MNRLMIVLLLLSLGGCTSYLHAKKCLPPKDGYQVCHHTVEYWTEAACTGSCAK